MRNFGQFYNALYRYKKQNGHLEVKTKYVTPEGLKLGKLVAGVRGNHYVLSLYEREKLNALGFVWHVTKQYNKRQSIADIAKLLKQYQEAFGTVEVPYDYVTENGIRFGTILSAIRLGIRKITPEQRKILSDMGVSFYREEDWKNQESKPYYEFDEVYEALEAYYHEFGNLRIPKSYVTKSGMGLGSILNNLRSGKRKTTPEQKKRLEAIGFEECHHRVTYEFDEVYSMLKRYYEEHGHCNIPFYYRNIEGIAVGKLANNLKINVENLSKEEIQKLDEISFYWKDRKQHKSFEQKYALLCEYKEKFGNVDVPQKYVTKDGVPLGRMVMAFRQRQHVTDEQRERLNQLGFKWRIHHHRNASFEQVYRALEEYVKLHGNCDVPYYYLAEDDMKLGFIVINIRSGHRKTTAEQKDMLNQLGFIW